MSFILDKSDEPVQDVPFVAASPKPTITTPTVAPTTNVNPTITEVVSSPSSPENSDDFVLVPNDIPTDPCRNNYDRK